MKKIDKLVSKYLFLLFFMFYIQVHSLDCLKFLRNRTSNFDQKDRSHCVHFALSKTRLRQLGTAQHPDVTGREILRVAAP